MNNVSIFRDGLFAGQAFLVTGASSGIGARTARDLAGLGASVGLVGRNEDKLAGVRDGLREQGVKAEYYVCDIRVEATVIETVQRFLADFGRMDGLVNNAGGQFFSPAEKISANGWDAVVRNNLLGGFLFAREAYNHWMREHGGAIVNMLADIWLGMPGMAHSGAARAGMLNLTQTLSYEWGPVRVNAVAPGWIASSGMDKYPEAVQPMIKRFPALVPAGRLGTEAEVAAAITFLLSPAAAFISGAVLQIDGAAPNRREHWPLTAASSTTPFNGWE